MDTLERWRRAVVHVEGAASSESPWAADRRWREYVERSLRGEAREGEKEEAGRSRSGDLRYTGTALFLVDAERYYLITARHVLYDPHRAKHDAEFEEEQLIGAPEFFAYFARRDLADRQMETIYSPILRIPSFREALARGPDYMPEALTSLAAGIPNRRPFTFSTPDLDLAVISLTQRDQRFAEQLLEKGYEPIDAACLGAGPSRVGADVFTVGFPGAASTVSRLHPNRTAFYWKSSLVSLPVFSWGRVSMADELLDFFW